MEPPEEIAAGDLLLRRWQPSFAGPAAEAVQESLAQLRPFLPWAHDNYGRGASLEFIAISAEDWATGTAYNYAIFTGDGTFAGGIGLMTRMGPGVLEIGYWMRTALAGRGYMTTAVDTLAGIALGLPGVERVAIRHDAANAASAAVATKAGFTEVGRVERAPEAPGETGTAVIRERR
ncbi:GNAT family N-acetyltransferase [Dactylosporangium sp. AC04546]|uniref:GNAT family N-acetyltransferase n=1 Tax=Dactylosporangium sp. AC04546 TaxID=2862460 RepID=UPI001EDE2269|nr:GNAT family N-acetyltransferase [Dactylosporangium sp. AC04546]WVK79688.1 GNAT family N-acetyltransferase [Dactylosporangium sp. AC04546]